MAAAWRAALMPALRPGRSCRAARRFLGSRGEPATAAARFAPRCPATLGSGSGTRAASSGAASAGSEEEAAKWRRVLPLAAAATASLGGLAYWSRQDGGLGGLDAARPRASFEIPPMAEETFEWADNLFVFFLNGQEEAVSRREELQSAYAAMTAKPSLRHLRFFYNARKADDPPMPEAPKAEASDGKPPIRVVMYKGQRKKVIYLTPDSLDGQVQEALAFYTPVAETLKESVRTALEVPLVSGQTFTEDVLEKSGPGSPILLQMYEDTCFLCFLMRPFVNALARLLRESGVPLRIKRLNLERNDFPDGCPVARGTPTFVLFRGTKAPALKWDEFKPKEIVDKIKEDFPGLGDDVYNTMDELQQLVSGRLQLFTQVVMWTVELQKLDRMYGAGITPSGSTVGSAASGGAAESASDHPADDSAFGAVVTELMLKDMRRHDELKDNLLHLQREVDELEHDAALMGAMLARQVAAREQEEAR